MKIPNCFTDSDRNADRPKLRHHSFHVLMPPVTLHLTCYDIVANKADNESLNKTLMGDEAEKDT